jgi:hypothetical protein
MRAQTRRAARNSRSASRWPLYTIAHAGARCAERSGSYLAPNVSVRALVLVVAGGGADGRRNARALPRRGASVARCAARIIGRDAPGKLPVALVERSGLRVVVVLERATGHERVKAPRGHRGRVVAAHRWSAIQRLRRPRGPRARRARVCRCWLRQRDPHTRHRDHNPDHQTRSLASVPKTASTRQEHLCVA